MSLCACLFMCNRFTSAYEFLSLSLFSECVFPRMHLRLLMIEYRYSKTIHLRERARAINCNFHNKQTKNTHKTRNVSFNLICVGIVSFLVKNNREKSRERTLNDLSLENLATITFVDLMFMRLLFNDRCICCCCFFFAQMDTF